MAKPKKQPAAVHWLRIEPTQEAMQHEILDRIEQWHRLDIVLAVHGLHCDDMHRIDTAACWCAKSAPITQAVDRMVRGNAAFRCVIHNQEITIRRALDPFMKTPAKRAALLEEHPAFRGILDGLFGTYFGFAAGQDYIQRACHAHQATALQEVAAEPGKPLKGLVIECINTRAAEFAFDRLDEDAPWRLNLEDLLNAAGELAPGWHGGLLTPEEQYRQQRDARIAEHRAFVRGLKAQEQERLSNEIAALK